MSTTIAQDIATVRQRLQDDYSLEPQVSIDAFERIVALLGDPGKAWSDGYDAACREFEQPAPAQAPRIAPPKFDSSAPGCNKCGGFGDQCPGAERGCRYAAKPQQNPQA